MDFPVNTNKKGGDSNRKGGRNRDRKNNKGNQIQNIYSSKHVRISNEKIEKCKTKSKTK